MLDLGQQILDTAHINRDAGDFVSIRFYTSKENAIMVRRGNAEDVSSERLEGVAIQALINGAWGFASVGGFDAGDIRETMNTAIKMAKGMSSRVKNPAKINTEWAFEGKNEFSHDLDPADMSFEEKLELAQKAEKIIREYDSKIINSMSRFTEKVQREEIVNTNGTRVSNDYGIFRLSGMATSRQGDIIQNVSDSVASSGGLQSIVDWDLDEKMNALAKRGVDLLDAEASPTGKMDVVIENSLVGVYIHEAFGHGSEGDAILAKNSNIADQIGNDLALDSVSVVDDPTIKGMRGSFAYDSEGTPTEKRDIIRDGTLVGYLNNLTTATMLESGNTLNGAGRATDYRHMSMPRMGNTYIEQGEMSFDELVQEVGNGVYLQNSYGGYVSPVKGEFFFSSQGGYLIEDGEVTRPIRNSGMSGLTLDVLKNTIGVGNDLMIDAFAGVCGKGNLTGYQPMPVTGGGPHIAARDIMVGGK
ncbi:MAG: TldD/PmbA family protein [Candidatus Kariarchaeaceae archaeon]|jgi:TldD protein